MELPPHDRLRSWLELPPGPWPPDHYALLGLTRGTGDFTEIETRVLDRMEQLRQHQLLHPETVTEGMNRLAQALVCLTDPVARAAYDRGLGIAPAPFEVVDDEPLADAIGATQSIKLPSEVPFEPWLRPPGDAPPPYEVVYYEVVPDTEVAESLPPAFEVVPDEETRPVPAPVEPTAPVAPVPPPTPIRRRTMYRRLAALRRAIRAWENLRPVMGNPAETLATPVAVLLFLQAVAETRAALPGIAFAMRGPHAPGSVVAALVRHPHVLHTTRTLLPTQREAVALDWRRGYDSLQSERARLRELAFVTHPRGRNGGWRKLLRAARRTPEWFLVALALAVVLLTLLRRFSSKFAVWLLPLLLLAATRTQG